MSDDFARPEFLVSTGWLADRLQDPDLRVFDCTVHLRPLPDNSGQQAASGRGDYEAGHIPGSAFIDLQDDLCDPSSPLRFVVPAADAFATAMSRLGVGPGLRVVLYDRSRNQWAARVWWMLRGFGFDEVIALAQAAKGEDEFGYRAEFIQLVRLAETAQGLPELEPPAHTISQ